MGRTSPLAGLTVDWKEVEPDFTRAWGRFRHTLNSTYARLAASAGMCPVAVLPCGRSEIASLLSAIDILVMTGGNDPDPALYGMSAEGCGSIDLERPRWEIQLYRAARAAGVPVLGICLGMQTMAIAEGSPLIRDIPTAPGWSGTVEHHGSAASPVHHGITTSGGLAGALFGPGATVSSFHHQAVASAPVGFTVTARAEDGIIEAIESDDGLAMGVQWHPERDGTGLALLPELLRRAGG